MQGEEEIDFAKNVTKKLKNPALENARMPSSVGVLTSRIQSEYKELFTDGTSTNTDNKILQTPYLQVLFTLPS